MRSKDALSEYNAKRDFSVTAEPKGEVGTGDSRIFIVQKHDATRLHFDFRLELDGVLKSWAVTRGPSLNPEDKRLAVRTEDHPISYASFEGNIAAGEYGGGTVMLWDTGHWKPVEGKDPSVTITEGHLHFHLFGQRLQGEWLLVRMKSRGKEKRENWLLRKINDEAASDSKLLVDTELTSIATGRNMSEIAAGKTPDTSAIWPKTAKAKTQPKKKSGKLPAFTAPQLATLVDSVPEGKGWIHEVKYDGYRCLIAVSGQDVRAYTRSGFDWSEKFAPIVEAVRDLALPPCLIDGEIVALDGKGRPNFSHLQSVLKGGKGHLTYFAFDLLELEGKSLVALPNVERKEHLQNLLGAAKGNKTVFIADHVTQGEKLFTTLCAQGYEGIISKKADAPYSGKRTRNWLKVKCTARQEFVLLGFTKSDKARGLKSLLLGTWVGKKLHYVGKVGTGFTEASMNALLDKMHPLVRSKAPADVPKIAARNATWLKPALFAEVAYAELTGPLEDGGVLRHASFLGLRENKSAAQVKPEQSVPLDDDPATVNITSRDRLIFPEAGVTKGALADYYAMMSDAILRNMANRPLSVVRCPQGRSKQCFFQKHDAGTFGPEVHHVAIKDKDGKSDDYLFVENSAGIVGCVQMGAIEFHGWGSQASNVEAPDKLVFDLDPDEGLDFEAVKKAAMIIKTELSHLGLESSAMLSGGKGIHVVVTLDGSADWPAVKDFASRFARALAQAKPDIFTANVRKTERKGRIFIDWLRNQRGATAVQPWTVRAREGAPVAMPIAWDELPNLKTASAFSLRDVDAIVQRAKSASLRNWATKKQKLPSV